MAFPMEERFGDWLMISETIMHEVRANFGIIFSKTGFTEKALEKCEVNNIGAKSLTPNNEVAIGFDVKFHIYFILHEWDTYQVSVHGAELATIPPEATINVMYINGQNLCEWFTYHLDIVNYPIEIINCIKEVEFKEARVMGIMEMLLLLILHCFRI